MKKILAVFICFCLLLSYMPSYALDKGDTADVKDKILVVKSRIGNTDEYLNFNSNITNYTNGECVYNLNWENESPYKYLQVTINQDDIITSYYKTNEAEYSSEPVFTYKSQSEIIDTAKNWFAEINPEIADEFTFETQEFSDLYSNSYTVYLKRFKNGIEIAGNSGSITLTKDLNEIINMRLNFNKIVGFDDPSHMIDSADATKSFTENLGYKLNYRINYISGKREAVLKYVPDYEYSEYIDALNGQVFDYAEQSNIMRDEIKTESSNDKLASGGGAGFSEAELSELSKIQGLLSTDVIEKKLKDNKYLQIEPNSKVEYTRLNRDYYDHDKYICRMEFSNGDENIDVSVDAENCNILNFSRYNISKNDSAEKLPNEKLYEIAQNISKGLAKDYFTDDSDNTLKFVETDEKAAILNSVRLVNGVEVSGNGLNVSVDEYTGKLRYYFLEWYDLDFPMVSEAISLERAYENLFDKIQYRPVYLPVESEGNTCSGKLIYNFELSNIIQDALTGKLEDYVEEKEKITDYSDVSGHYAEEIINQLKSFGIGFAGGEFKPNDIITQGEFVTLLAYVFRRGVSPIICKSGNDFSQSYYFVRTKNLIPEEEIDENAEVTREKACVMLVKAMGYDEVAKLENIFIPTFNDISVNKGYVAILSEKNIVSGDGMGSFNPEKALTRADAIIILYNYLIN